MYYFIRKAFTIFLFVTAHVTHGQLCTGNLGDPVVHITFGSAGLPDNSFTPPSAYTYTPSTCPRDGFYTITSATQGCFNSTWHTVSSDRTGSGNFMLVNASFSPGDFFRTEVADLCPNTTYEFAAWVMNVLRGPGAAPELSFTIEKADGTVLGQYTTGAIPTTSSPEWKQFGFYFVTPADNSKVILRITNNAPGGLGNDLALDDITFRPCGPVVTASISGMGGSVDVCEEKQVPLEFVADPSSYYSSPSIQWQVSTDSGKSWNDIKGATARLYIRNKTLPGKYWYRFSVAENGTPASCRINSNSLVVNVWARPVVNAGPDRVLLSGDSITLKAKADSNSTYRWLPEQYLSNANVLTPQAFPPTQITYNLKVTSSKGCVNEDMVTIKVIDKIYIPTAFTPNNDGKNDHWRIPFIDPEWGASLKIYNRYGMLVFQQEGSNISWDGRMNGIMQSTGVYIYTLTIKSTGVIYKGTITLIR